METAIWGLGLYIGILSPILENQMEKTMEHEMETGVICWVCRLQGFPQIRGIYIYMFGGLHNKGYIILRSVLGSPYFGNVSCPVVAESLPLPPHPIPPSPRN